MGGLSYDRRVNSKDPLSLTFMIIVASAYSVVMVFYCAEKCGNSPEDFVVFSSGVLQGPFTGAAAADSRCRARGGGRPVLGKGGSVAGRADAGGCARCGRGKTT